MVTVSVSSATTGKEPLATGARLCKWSANVDLTSKLLAGDTAFIGRRSRASKWRLYCVCDCQCCLLAWKTSAISYFWEYWLLNLRVPGHTNILSVVLFVTSMNLYVLLAIAIICFLETIFSAPVKIATMMRSGTSPLTFWISLVTLRLIRFLAWCLGVTRSSSSRPVWTVSMAPLNGKISTCSVDCISENPRLLRLRHFSVVVYAKRCFPYCRITAIAETSVSSTERVYW